MNDEAVRNIAPFINQRFKVTSKWWAERINPVTGRTEIHKGLDIATPTSVGNAPVYSMVTNGVVVQRWNNHYSMGNAIVIKSRDNNYATLYMHLDRFTKNVGDNVARGELVGYEGATGDVTGIHLHVEMQDMGNRTSWYFSDFKYDYLDPTEYMGIDNVVGTWWIYDGIPPEPTPTEVKKTKFKWVLYARKLRENT